MYIGIGILTILWQIAIGTIIAVPILIGLFRNKINWSIIKNVFSLKKGRK